MRVLLANKFFYRGGGAETVFFDTRDVLEEAGHCVIPFAMRDSKNEGSEWDRFFVRQRDYIAGRRANRARDAAAALYSVETRRRLRALIQRARPDVAHLHNVYHHLSLSVVDELARAHIPVVMTLHDYKAVCPNYLLLAKDGPCTRCVPTGAYWNAVRHRCVKNSVGASVVAATEAYFNRARGAYAKVDRFVAPSRFIRDIVHAGGIPLDRIDVVRNPVALDRKKRSANTSPTFVYFGRLSPEKGLDVLLDAASLLDPGIRVRILGTGPIEGDLRARAASHRLPVDFRGHQDAASVEAEVASATAAVLPARGFENSPMSVLEAAAQGVPTIASAIGGIPEIVSDGATGLLVRPGDAPSLAQCMNALARDVHRARALGDAALSRVTREHDRTGYLESLLAVYEDSVRTAMPDEMSRQIA